jgi:hypothetical protein
MLAQLLLNLNLSHWETWAAPIAGAASLGLMLMLVRSFWRDKEEKQKATSGAADAEAAQMDALDMETDPFDYGSSDERRSSARRAGKTVKVLVSDATGQAEPFTGWVYDRSLSGLRLGVPRPVEAHEVLSIRLLEGASALPWIQVEVKRCRAGEGCWELGCRFVRTPPYSQLLLFG